jgi:hypothetical protein
MASAATYPQQQRNARGLRPSGESPIAIHNPLQSGGFFIARRLGSLFTSTCANTQPGQR